MQTRRLNLTASLPLLALALALGACSSRPVTKAPVEDRGTFARPGGATGVSGASGAGAVIAQPATAKPLPGAENAGKPGYYTVRPGDTLIRIGLDTGQNWRDIGRWNNLDNPNVIEVGQVLRISAPGPVGGDGVVARPVGNAPAVTANPLPPQGQASAKPAEPGMTPPGSKPPASEDDLAWIWPAQGTQVAGFDEVKNKGLDIAGKAGDPVLAAADGRVVYSGSGLRGYGNLIILKHNNTFLTAYAHNQALLVKEDQNVKQGQKIAEMGSTDADRVKLHFEIRRQGKPVDPAKYLPPR